MKKWIDNHMNWIAAGLFILVMILIFYSVMNNLCYDCPAANMTSGDLIA
jgi:hypothetical protein